MNLRASAFAGVVIVAVAVRRLYVAPYIVHNQLGHDPGWFVVDALLTFTVIAGGVFCLRSLKRTDPES